MDIKLGDSGAAVEDIQQRLSLAGVLDEGDVSGTFDERTLDALHRFLAAGNLAKRDSVDDKTWALLVDASYNLGDRTLYLRMPHFHGHDVLELQHALGALGFFCGKDDGIFGASTELALRKFQLNMGIPSDGIAGAYTFAELRNLEFSWAGKGSISRMTPMGFARAADVLEQNPLCLFGTDEFTRSVASRMSNLALATNPASKIVSADALSVVPDDKMLLVQIALQTSIDDDIPVVHYSDDGDLPARLSSAIVVAKANLPLRVKVVLPGMQWLEAGEERSAQHFAITLLDALCQALAAQQEG